MKHKTLLFFTIGGLVIFFAACVTQTAPGPAMSMKPFTGHTLSRLRGSMCGDGFEEQNFADFAAMGANQVRWNLSFPWDPDMENINLERREYLDWLDGAMADAQKAAEACRRYHMLMVLDLASPPGGRRPDGVFRMFYDEKYAALFLEAWDIITARFKNYTSIYAFEIVNEPYLPVHAGADGGLWTRLFLKVVARIRALDPDRAVVYHPCQWGSPQGYIGLEPLPIDKIIYSVHMYVPDGFTFQFRTKIPARYPGTVLNNYWEKMILEYSGKPGAEENYWDKDMLRMSLKPVLDFQKKYNVQIWVGEFGAVRWAPDNSTYRYLKDCIDIFEEYGWDWSYHAFRSSDVWNYERGTDEFDQRLPSAPPNRQVMIQSYLAMNEHP